ncbi:MAG: cell division protein FtsZ [Clostridium sp.]|nr:cell division protein FtsZ [Clostridium sp.]
MTPEDIRDNHDFIPSGGNASIAPYSSNRIKVIGVGGGGNNAINHMYRLGVRDVTFIVANTDRQALNNSPVPNRVLLGPSTLKGRGAGNRPEKAHAAAEESAAEIDALFDDETDMVFITAGMGGGTGTGASPVIAKIAKERGILTIGIVTIPFLFEGQKKILKALEGANEMGKFVDALLVINNERLGEIYKDSDFLNAFGKADDILSMAAMSISEIVTCNGYINLDFNDVDNTLRDGGTAIISTGYGEGENRVQKAIEDALHSPLLRNTDIFGSRKLLFNLYFSTKASQAFKIDETKQITDFISNLDSDVDVIWGVAIDDSLGDKVKFTILAAGFEVTISDDQAITSPLVISDDKQDAKAKTQEEQIAAQRILGNEYGDKIEGLNRQKAQKSYIILRPEQLDSDQAIAALEQNPTFNRDRAIIDSLKAAAPAAQPPTAQAQLDKNTISFDDI